MSLVERFRQTHVRQHVEHCHRENAVIPRLYRTSLPNIRTLDTLKQKFPETIFKDIDRTYAGPFTAEALSGLPAIGQYPAVVLAHYIPAGLWRKHHAALLTWYMTEFWVGDFVGKPLFLIFLNIEYPEPASVFQRFKIGRIRKKLERLAHSVQSVCPCLLFPETGRVSKPEVIAWFDRHFPAYESVWRKRTDEFFKGASEKSMAETEEFLEQETNRFDKTEYKAMT